MTVWPGRPATAARSQPGTSQGKTRKAPQGCAPTLSADEAETRLVENLSALGIVSAEGRLEPLPVRAFDPPALDERPVRSQRPQRRAFARQRLAPRPRGQGAMRLVLPVLFLILAVGVVAAFLESRPQAGKAPKSPGLSTSATATYTVKQGDTFASVAARYHTTVKELKRLNPDLNGRLPSKGETIAVPSP